MENHKTNVCMFWRPVAYIWEIWDLDDTFEELHFSGSVEELSEAAEENKTVTDRTYERYKSVLLQSNTDNLPCEQISEALSMSQKNIWSDSCKNQSRHLM